MCVEKEWWTEARQFRSKKIDMRGINYLKVRARLAKHGTEFLGPYIKSAYMKFGLRKNDLPQRNDSTSMILETCIGRSNITRLCLFVTR